MKIKSMFLIYALMLTIISPVYAEEISVSAPTEYIHEGKIYPPVLFQTNIDNSAFKIQFQSYNAFESLDEESLGLPIGVLIRLNQRMKADAKGISSLLVSASTLGIVPVMSNKEFSINYDVYLQGKSIASFNYDMTTSNVANFWTGIDGIQKVKPEEELFMDKTIVLFLNDLKKNTEIQGYFEEYNSYYRD